MMVECSREEGTLLGQAPALCTCGCSLCHSMPSDSEEAIESVGAMGLGQAQDPPARQSRFFATGGPKEPGEHSVLSRELVHLAFSGWCTGLLWAHLAPCTD